MNLPPQTELVLYLLAEELKASYFFQALTRLSLDGCWYQPFLGSAIFRLMQFDDHDDGFLTRPPVPPQPAPDTRPATVDETGTAPARKTAAGKEAEEKHCLGGTGTPARHPGQFRDVRFGL